VGDTDFFLSTSDLPPQIQLFPVNRQKTWETALGLAEGRALVLRQQEADQCEPARRNETLGNQMELVMTRSTKTNRAASCFAAAIVTLIAGSTLFAQSAYNYDDTLPGPNYQPTPQYPVEMGFTQHHSSTAEEGARRGRAAEIQAAGIYEVQKSQAAVLNEQARWLNRENDLKQTQALQAQEEMWREQSAKDRKDREARKAEGLKKLAQRKATVLYATYQLTKDELDVRTGRIFWPVILQDAKYRQARERLEELFREHVQYGEPQSGTAKEIAHYTEQLKRALQDDISTLPSDEYFAAQKFLLGLKYEAQHLVEAA
jgi:hypothetical protein